MKNATHPLLGLGLALLLAGCGALPDKPQRATLYDFGPGPMAAQQASSAPTAQTSTRFM